MKINIPVDYIRGNLISGHLEGEINFSEYDERIFKELLQRELDNNITREEEEKLDDYKDIILCNCSLMVDEYDIDEWGYPYWGDLLDEK